jgi:hypothetical protein
MISSASQKFIHSLFYQTRHVIPNYELITLCEIKCRWAQNDISMIKGHYAKFEAIIIILCRRMLYFEFHRYNHCIYSRKILTFRMLLRTKMTQNKKFADDIALTVSWSGDWYLAQISSYIFIHVPDMIVIWGFRQLIVWLIGDDMMPRHTWSRASRYYFESTCPYRHSHQMYLLLRRTPFTPFWPRTTNFSARLFHWWEM